MNTNLSSILLLTKLVFVISTASVLKNRTINLQGANMPAVWPNPARDLIHVQNNSEINGIARIYSQSGALISETKMQEGINTINVSSLSFGVYIINFIRADGQSYNKKFVKQ